MQSHTERRAGPLGQLVREGYSPGQIRRLPKTAPGSKAPKTSDRMPNCDARRIGVGGLELRQMMPHGVPVANADR